MGKKKDELKETIALAHTSLRQLEIENQALREQIAEGYAVAPFRLVTDAPPTPIRAKIAEALGVDAASLPAGGITDEMILGAVERLRNPQLGSFDDLHPEERPSMAMTKGDSLAEAIAHNAKQRSDLSVGLTQARNIVNRVAGALGVGQWNADGDEIVEKAQRFGVFAYWLRKRLRAIEADRPNAGGFDVERSVADARIEEIRQSLAALLADKELAKLLQNKPAKVSKTVLDLAENHAPTGITYLDHPFEPDDAKWIHEQLRRVATAAHPRIDQLYLVFGQIAKSAAATEEFCSFMNAIVLPVLRKQHPAYQTMPKEN